VLFAPLTRAPRTTEDVEFSVGLAIRNYALAKGAGEALVVDAHNAETGEIIKVESGNPISFEYMEAVADALARGGREAPFRAGFAGDAMEDLRSSIGAAGMQAAVFECGGKKLAYLLFDANGTTPEFRRELIDAASAMGMDCCEVLTTDTHSVNKVGGVLNPVGGRHADRDEIRRRAEQALKAADAGLSETEVAGSLELVKGVKVFGVAQSSELLGTINSIVAIVRVVAPLLLVAAAAATLWAMTKI
jgi:putative membrane protein